MEPRTTHPTISMIRPILLQMPLADRQSRVESPVESPVESRLESPVESSVESPIVIRSSSEKASAQVRSAEFPSSSIRLLFEGSLSEMDDYESTESSNPLQAILDADPLTPAQKRQTQESVPLGSKLALRKTTITAVRPATKVAAKSRPNAGAEAAIPGPSRLNTRSATKRPPPPTKQMKSGADSAVPRPSCVNTRSATKCPTTPITVSAKQSKSRAEAAVPGPSGCRRILNTKGYKQKKQERCTGKGKHSAGGKGKQKANMYANAAFQYVWSSDDDFE